MGSMTHNEIYYNLAPSQDQDKLGMRLFIHQDGVTCGCPISHRFVAIPKLEPEFMSSFNYNFSA